jgi:hypothetical protein
LGASILFGEWGWTIPVLVAEDGTTPFQCPEAPRLGWLTEGDADNRRAVGAAILKLEEFPLELLGFDDSELASILNSRSVGATDPDDAPPLPANPIARPGDLWQLGRHLLVCGDATERADVEMLLAGAQPHLMIVDPPYGVEYEAPVADWRVRLLGCCGLGLHIIRRSSPVQADRFDRYGALRQEETIAGPRRAARQWPRPLRRRPPGRPRGPGAP